MYTVLKLFKRQFPKILNERVSEEETKKELVKKKKFWLRRCIGLYISELM